MFFLSRTCNKAVVEVTGPKVNRGAGYGLEVPCVSSEVPKPAARDPGTRVVGYKVQQIQKY
jgi:hypothetical protein